MREPGSDRYLNVMFCFKTIPIICLMTLLTKGEEGQNWNRFPHIPDFASLMHCLLKLTVRLDCSVIKQECSHRAQHPTFLKQPFILSSTSEM